MTVMTIGLVAAFGGQIGTNKVMRQSRETQLVLSRLEALMEYAHSQKADDLPEGEDSVLQHGVPVVLDDDMGLRDLVVITTYEGFDAGEVPPDPLFFRIEATWTDFERRERSLSVASVVTR